ncbi:TonB-dependent receptor [Tenacibaculum sediminilitoris]|uniref:TonB-dependent receptor n=1 Tax=Tenacibaculum sediminilitoris TaxID=1820334 RepID=UPI00389562D6
MRKFITLLFFFTTVNLISQENDILLTLNFENLTKQEIFQQIENKSIYKFYYLNKWFDNKTESKNYINKPLSKILTDLLQDSDLNYFITDEKKVILTKGLLIRRSIYDENVKQSSTPVLVKNNTTVDKIIGKEVRTPNEYYTLSGVIKSEKNNKPIEGVTIFEKNKNIFTTTDSRGRYSINLPYGKNKIKTSLSGFSSEVYDIVMYDDGTLNFSLLEKLEELDEIIVKGSKSNNLRENVTGLTLIKAKDIKTIPQVLGERDLLRAALTLPGIKSAGEGAEGINVRGGKVDQNLFLLDGGVMYNPTHFLGLFSAINPFTTDDLKIFKGNIPTEYGGRLSSVFDITTSDASTKKFNGEASIGPVTGNIKIETPIVKNKSGLLIGVRSTYSEWVLQQLNNKELKNSKVNFYDVIAKYNHKFNKKNKLKITGYYSSDKFQIASDSVNNYRNKIISLNWEHKFNKKNIGNLTLSNSSYDFDILYDANNNRDFNLNYKINESNIKLKFNYKHSKKHVFDYGLEAKLYNVNPGRIKPEDENSSVPSVNIPKERGLENALFISDNVNFSKKLSLNLGLRFSQYLGLGAHEQRIYESNKPKNSSNIVETNNYDSNEIYKTYNGFSYRVGSRYSLTDDLSIKASINKSFQYIHRLSNNTTASPLDTWRLSDSNILPQEGLQFSLGVLKYINDTDYEVSLETYYKQYKNLIDYKVGANLLLNETIETEVLQGPGKSYGLEFLIKKNQGSFNGWLGYSYSRSLIKLDSQFDEEKVNNGEYFPTNYDKPHNLDIVFNYKITQRYSISSNFSYQTGRPVTYPTGKYTYNNTEYLTYSNRNEYRIPDYFRLDIGLNIEGNHKIKKFAHSFWNISVYNVLGRNNPYSVYFETKNGNVTSYKSSVFSVPIPTITYNFKF